MEYPPGTMTEETSYEMFWDCAFCGSKELLGLTHRHCPTCGGPQDPSTRYFPPDERKVAVAEHRFVGADKLCGSCGTSAAASASHCPGCGSPLDGEGEVARVADAAAVAPAAAAPTPAPVTGGAQASGGPAKKKGGWLKFVLLGAVVLIVGVIAYGMLAKQDAAATVVGHRWSRSVTVQRFQEVSAEGWCDALPRGARRTGSTSRERSTRQVADGEDCTSRNVDQGDGTFRQEQDCRPRTRAEPVMDQWCTYRAERWEDQRPTLAEGSGLEPAPSWPKAAVDGCARLGCTREGARLETYTLEMQIEGEDPKTCALPESRWRAAAPGSRHTVQMNPITGSLDCQSMLPLQ